MRCHVDAEIVQHGEVAELHLPDVAPFALVVEHDARLVLELIVPAFGYRDVDQPMIFGLGLRSEEHTSELQSLMRISYAVFCLKKKKKKTSHTYIITNTTNR